MQTSGTGVPTAFCPALKSVAVRGPRGEPFWESSVPFQSPPPWPESGVLLSLWRGPSLMVCRDPSQLSPGRNPVTELVGCPVLGSGAPLQIPVGSRPVRASSLPAALASQWAEGQEASRG